MLLQQRHSHCSPFPWGAVCLNSAFNPHSCALPSPIPQSTDMQHRQFAVPSTDACQQPRGSKTVFNCNDVAEIKAALATCQLEEVPKLIRDSSVKLGAAAYTMLISVCGKRGDLAKARKVFETVPEPNVWHVSALISAYANAGDWLNAVKQLKQSVSDGIQANTVTYSTTIEACARTGHLDIAAELFREMADAGLQPDSVTYAILLTHFSRNSDWAQVDALLEEMHAKGMPARTPIYALYICHLCRSGEWNRALSLYLVMRELGAEVTTGAYWELMQALCAAGKPRMVAQLLQEAHADNIPDCHALFDASLSALLASGFYSKANTLHTLMTKQGWAHSPAYTYLPKPYWEPVAAGGVGTSSSSAGMAATGSGSVRRPSSCSAGSSCCSLGDMPPAAVEAGRGQRVPGMSRSSVTEAALHTSAPQLCLKVADSCSFSSTATASFNSNSFSSTASAFSRGATSLTANSTDGSVTTTIPLGGKSDNSGSPTGRADSILTDWYTQRETYERARSCGVTRGTSSVTNSITSSPVGSPMTSCTSAELVRAESCYSHGSGYYGAATAAVAKSATGPGCTGVYHKLLAADTAGYNLPAVNSSPSSSAQQAGPAADLSGAVMCSNTKTAATNQAEAAAATSPQGLTVKGFTGGLVGPYYAHIPTYGPDRVTYTVAGPYYQDPVGRWFGMTLSRACATAGYCMPCSEYCYACSSIYGEWWAY